nr:hypothetical protein [Tanacetum cinerariifolium]
EVCQENYPRRSWYYLSSGFKAAKKRYELTVVMAKKKAEELKEPQAKGLACPEGRCAPNVLTAALENREKAVKLLACIPKARLECLFARVRKSEVDVEEALNGLLDQIHERDSYPVTGI